jgi:uncharacterized protein (DUF2062 family)
MIHLTKAAIARWLERLLHTHDTPQRTAAAFALGVFIGFSPPIGLHTVICLVLAFMLDLNRVAVLLGACANLPWFTGPYYTLATIVGAALLGANLPPGLLGELRDVLAHWGPGEIRHLLTLLRPLFWAYTLGSALMAAALAALAYPLALTFIVARRRRHPAHATDN